MHGDGVGTEIGPHQIAVAALGLGADRLGCFLEPSTSFGHIVGITE